MARGNEGLHELVIPSDGFSLRARPTHLSSPPDRAVRVQVCCAADDLYAVPLTVMLKSLLGNLGPQSVLEVVVVDGGIRPVSKRTILASIRSEMRRTGSKVSFVAPPEMPASLPVSGHITRAAYLRLFLDRVLPMAVSRVVYLDCDVVVADDITHLWNTPLGNAVIGAVRDANGSFVSSPGAVKNWKKLRLSKWGRHFNSGVLLVNLARWRRLAMEERCLQYISDFGDDIGWHDQDVLNAVCGNRWTELHPKWNLQHAFLNYFGAWAARRTNRSALRSGFAAPGIIHYSGTEKPWHPRDQNPFRAEFHLWLRNTSWSTHLLPKSGRGLPKKRWP